MTTQQQIDFDRVANAIDYVIQNFKRQPSLDEVAEHVHLSPAHFQRLFTDWAGVSPKKFLQYTSLSYAKQLLHGKKASLFDTAYETGLSGTGRLHDLFVNIEGMTPAEYKNGGENLLIQYSFSESPFGLLIIASTHKGICHLAFCNDEAEGFSALQNKFPKARFEKAQNTPQQSAIRFFSGDWRNLQQVKLHLKGTEFQLKVWEALLKIPLGAISTYGKVAAAIDSPKASRAVGTAIGDNPVAFLIPCHRVIQSTGAIGGYMWGPTRKRAILGWEAVQVDA